MNYVEYLIKDRLAYITMNRPDKRNALSFEFVSELKEAFTRAENDVAVKVIILKANGAAFCAGADLSYLQRLQNFSYSENLSDSNHLKELFRQVYTLKKIVIAQVQGHALAGGCGLANVCDFTFSVPEARFGYPEVRIGFIPAIVMVFLLRKIGEHKAKQLLLSGESITADVAMQLGLVNEVVNKEDLAEYVKSFANRLTTFNSSHSMMLTKQMISQVQSYSFEESLTFAAEMNAKARSSEDCKRGIASFLNEEKITW